MSHLPFSERDIERLLEGNVPPGRGDLVELARLFARVRAGVAGEPIPPMSARLLAELDAAELDADLSGRLRSEFERAADRRRVQRGRRRWRAVAAAAAVVVVGGAVAAGLRGPLGDDLRTRPGDEPVSVAEPGGEPSSTLADDDAGGAVETADPDESPNINASDDEGSGDIGVPGGAGGVATTEVPTTAPPTTAADVGGAGDGGRVDWDDVADECDGNSECVIDAAERECASDGLDCWARAAEACGRDQGCREMLANMCGASRDCREAVWDGPSHDDWP